MVGFSQKPTSNICLSKDPMFDISECSQSASITITENDLSVSSFILTVFDLVKCERSHINRE